MKVVEYINSGVIEDYCLGVLNALEMQKVRQLAGKYQEIYDAIAFAESVLIKYAEDLDKERSMEERSEEILVRLLKKIKQ
jgi:anti-sigma-K factor RskA